MMSTVGNTSGGEITKLEAEIAALNVELNDLKKKRKALEILLGNQGLSLVGVLSDARLLQLSREIDKTNEKIIQTKNEKMILMQRAPVPQPVRPQSVWVPAMVH